MVIKKNKVYSKRTVTSKGVKRYKNKRPVLNSKEELIAYLEKNLIYGFELPFVQEAWDKAVENFESFKDDEKYDENGKIIRRVRPNSVVACYFQLMGFKNFQDIGKRLLKERDVQIIPYVEGADLSEEEKAEICFKEELNTSKETTPHYNNWLIAWINSFNKDESEFLRQRFADYYNQYDINDGADKTVLMNILSIEIQLYRINTEVSKGRPVNILDVNKLNTQLVLLLDAQKWTKKQRSASDDAISNKFTVWLDQMMKNGKFVEKKYIYEEDQVDKLLNSFISAMREVSI